MTLNTERLLIIPLKIEQFAALLAGIDKMEAELRLATSGESMDEETLMAMQGLYDEALKHPEDYWWYTNWQIILKSENKSIGSACFKKHPKKQSSVEIGYGINTPYRNMGYATEAIKAMCEWALSQPEIKTVTAETESNNMPSQKVLTNCGLTMHREANGLFFWQICKTDQK